MSTNRIFPFLVCIVVGLGVTDASVAQVKTRHCDATQRFEMGRVSARIAREWSGIERAIEAATGQNIGSCLKKKFQGKDGPGGKPGNGTVVCVKRGLGKSSPVNQAICAAAGNGFGLTLTRSVLFCESFLDKVARMSKANRRACYATLMVHEFYHSCFRNLTLTEKENSNVRKAERAAFNFWKNEVAKGGAVTLANANACF